MALLKEYVKNDKEVEKVSDVRKGYVKKYSDFIIKKGKINKNSIMVDVPCGTGDMSKEISEKINPKKIALLDLNENMVERANKKVKNSVSFVGEAGNIGKIIDFKVDTIICLNGFHQYFKRKEDFLKGCEKILKKKGRLIFDISTRGLNDEKTRRFFKKQIQESKKLAKKIGCEAKFPNWPNKSTPIKYKQMISKLNLKILEEVEFKTFEDIKKPLKDSIIIPGRSRPWFPRIGFDKRKEILKKSMEKASKEVGKNRLEYNRIFFVIEKK